jgi:GNAT superfamily N-acetyltransferase
MKIDVALIGRWLSGRSLSRGLPLPVPYGGGLLVVVDNQAELRRYVFADAGPELQACADQIRDPRIFLKAAVDTDTLRRALPGRWHVQPTGYLMMCPAAAASQAEIPTGYSVSLEREYGAQAVRVIHGSGERAASGRVALNDGCAVFDQIETTESHRRRGLGTAVMLALDAIAQKAGVSERLLVATEEGRALYGSLGWRVLAPWSTAVLPSP